MPLYQAQNQAQTQNQTQAQPLPEQGQLVKVRGR